MPAPTELAAAEPQLTILAPRAAVAWSAIAPTSALAAPRAFFALAGRSRLRALDQRFGLNERAVFVLGDQLEADAATSLVHLEDFDVEDVLSRGPAPRFERGAGPREITSSMWATRPGPTFETWRRPSVPFFSSTNAPKSVVFTTFPVYSSPTSGSFVRASMAAMAAWAFGPSVA